MNIVSGINNLNVTMVLIKGSLSGLVTDEDNAPIGGVTVALSGDNGSHSATTGSDGSYNIENIKPGTYTATFTKDGYTAVTQ